MPNQSIAFDPRRPFLYRAARDAGISRRQLAGPGYRRLFTGVYIAAGVDLRPEIWAQAALMVAPKNTVIARHTAARIWGGVPPDEWRTHITTLVAPTAVEPPPPPGPLSPPSTEEGRHRSGERKAYGRVRLEGIDARVSSDETRLVWIKGMRVTDPVRTFLDSAADLGLVDLVVLGDSLVKNTDLTPQDLIDAAATPGRYRKVARRAASFVRSEVDSPQESRLRMLIVLAGLPEPDVNIEIVDAFGRVRRRLDMGYRKYLIGVEYEGRQHAEDPGQWASDIARREELDNLGWRLVLVIAKGVYQEAGTTLERLARLLRERGCTDAQVRSTEWRRYFGPVGHRMR